MASNRCEQACKALSLQTPFPMLTEQQRNRVFNIIIVTQCLGMLSTFLFQNGFYLNYFTKLGFSSATFALLTVLPSLIGGFLLIPFAFFSDRIGKLPMSLIGQVMLIVSLFLMLAAGWVESRDGLLAGSRVIAAVLYRGEPAGVKLVCITGSDYPEGDPRQVFRAPEGNVYVGEYLFTLLVTAVLKVTQSIGAFQSPCWVWCCWRISRAISPIPVFLN